jgi:hypothetical protein
MSEKEYLLEVNSIRVAGDRLQHKSGMARKRGHMLPREDVPTGKKKEKNFSRQIMGHLTNTKIKGASGFMKTFISRFRDVFGVERRQQMKGRRKEKTIRKMVRGDAETTEKLLARNLKSLEHKYFRSRNLFQVMVDGEDRMVVDVYVENVDIHLSVVDFTLISGNMAQLRDFALSIINF